MKRGEASWDEVIRLTIGLVLLGAAAMSLCLCVNLWILDDRTKFYTANKLPLLRRNWFTASMLVSFAIPWIAVVPGLIKRPLASVSRAAFAWGHRVAPLIVLGLAAPLLNRSAYSSDPTTTLLWTLVIGLLAAVLLTGFLDHGRLPLKLRSPLERSRPRAWLPTAVVVVTSLLLFAHFAVYSLMRHYQLSSQSHDLGIFDNMVWSLAHWEGFRASPTLGPQGTHLVRHATFGAVLLAPFYLLHPQADTLLVIQALMVASTPIPIYLMARRVLGSPWIACALGVSYALYAPVHGGVFYDFHFLTTASPLIAWVFYLLHTERTVALSIMTAIALTWREDIGAILAGGGSLVFIRGIHRTRTFIFIVVCVIYFVIIAFVVMPSLGPGGGNFQWIYRELWPENQHNFGGVLQTLLTNPTYAFEAAFQKSKGVFILQLFVPVLFMPLRHRYAWVAVLPAGIFTLLATKYPPVYSIAFQYSAYWGPAMFLAVVVALNGRFAERGRTSSLSANVIAILLVGVIVSFHFGSVFESKAFRGGFSHLKYEWTEEDAEKLAAFRRLAAMVPPDATVVATENEVPHLSNRRNCFTMRIGHYNADYMLLRTSHVRSGEQERNTFKHALETGQYGFVEAAGPFTLWKRGHSTSRNAEGERLIGVSRSRLKKNHPE